MTVAGTNPARSVAGMAVALVLCGVVAVGVARWPDIQFELGYAYESGNFHRWSPGFSRDDHKAAYWLDQAALANHPRAQYMPGIHYAQGWGVPKGSA